MQYLSIHEVEAPPPLIPLADCPHALGCMAVAVLYDTARNRRTRNPGNPERVREFLDQAVNADTIHQVRQQCVACAIARNALFPNVYYG
jgi:hypothetical protein